MEVSATDIILKTCIDKVSLSEEVANRIVDRHASKGEILYYYKCRWCGSYHMTSHDGTIERLEIIGGK